MVEIMPLIREIDCKEAQGVVKVEETLEIFFNQETLEIIHYPIISVKMHQPGNLRSVNVILCRL